VEIRPGERVELTFGLKMGRCRNRKVADGYDDKVKVGWAKAGERHLLKRAGLGVGRQNLLFT
jgi:hypothetical protein